MSLLIDGTRNGPQTHALIIGVGAYPNLRTPNLPADLRDLEPLPSAPMSARALLDWLDREYDNASAPLGTVECLISDPEGTATFNRPPASPADIGRATMDGIRTAFNSWYARCDADAANVAIFYFCGHGFMKLFSSLLSEDFGRNPLSPFRDAINFEMMAMGMSGCRAGTQVLLADACRQVPRTAIQMLDDLPSDPLVDPKAGGLKERKALIAQGAAAGFKAFTPADKPTQFTQALLRCLRGDGSERVAGTWAVTLAKLGYSLQEAMGGIENTSDTVPQTCEVRTEKSANVVLHRLAGKPDVRVQIGCRPEAAMLKASLAITVPGETAVLRSRGPLPGPPAKPWELVVPAGMYSVAASFDADTGYRSEPLAVFAMPPACAEDLEVQS